MVLKPARYFLLLLPILVVAESALAEYPVRVASYNIFFLEANVSSARVAKLKQVIDKLDADVIGLQEIADRAALERIFDPAEWSIVIDDQSDDDQDVAAVVRKPFRVLRRDGRTFDLDADNEDFLFSGPQFESAYPIRRDALCVLVRAPQDQGEFFLIVNHWKSRKGGRDYTDPLRQKAARLLASKIKRDFNGKNVIIVGDFNDNPDDRSLNILETGNDNAPAGPEEQDGPLLINAMEKLVAQDYCSWDVRVVNGRLRTIVPGSRNQNNAAREIEGPTVPILFDQILFPLHMAEMYVDGSASVFSDPVARTGNGPNGNTASDHIPVFADFVLKSATPFPTPPMPARDGIRIAELMVDPDGEDSGNEWVLLKNSGSAAVNLAGWRLRDRSNNVLPLTGTVPANGERRIVDRKGQMPLNNSGDDVVLLNAQNEVVHRVTYRTSDVSTGQPIVIANP